MKELFRELAGDSDARHRLMLSMPGSDKATKTLIYDYDIRYCSGEEGFYREHLDEIMDVRSTGIYEIGGRELYCEVLEELPKLVVCGAGHVGAACIKAASMLDMHITCIEDREDFAAIAREMGAHDVICGEYGKALDGIEGGDNTYFLSMTRAHAFDQLCLERILRKPSAYVGMLGSAAKIGKIRSNLAGAGMEEELFDKVHAPVGLDINACTPEEIAIAVMAEIIAVKNNGRVISNAFTHEQLDAVFSDAGCPVLVTLIRKLLPSPREVGTKMIVTSDGKKWGTIGGGAAEAQALSKARELIEDPDFEAMTLQVGDEDRSGSGEVCGGVIEVLFERI